MRTLALILPTLSGCYLLADGTIPTTCDDLPACAGADDSSPGGGGDDTGGWGEPWPTQGVALSATDGESWTLSAFEPPYDAPAYQRGGQGSFAGPLIFDEAGSRAAIAAQGRLYVFGSTVDQISSYEIPSDEAPVAMAWLPSAGGICVITPAEVFWQRASGDGTLDRIDTATSFDGARQDVFLDEDGTGMYLLTRSSSDKANLFHYTGATKETQVATDFVANPRLWLGGGGFIGPEGAVTFCSTDGGIHTLDTLVSGSTAPLLKIPGVSEVLRCAWDSSAGLYLMVTAAGEVYAVTPDGTSRMVSDPLDAALTAAGAFIY